MEKVRLNEKNKTEIEKIQQIFDASGSAIVNYLVSNGVEVLRENLKKIDNEFKEAFREALKELNKN